MAAGIFLGKYISDEQKLTKRQKNKYVKKYTVEKILHNRSVSGGDTEKTPAADAAGGRGYYFFIMSMTSL